jgi:UDP:flavonoid glycosyltransferase YjiC (YdhE family)
VRVLFCCRPAYGHVYPLLPLASAVRDAGHEVSFGTGDAFLGPLRERGFAAERVGIAIDEADRLALEAKPELNDLPREERWRFGVVVFADVLPRRTLADLGPLLAEQKPDLVVYDETDVGAAVAADLAGIPAITHSLGRQLPDAFRPPALGRLRELEPSARDPFLERPYLDICPPALRDPAAAEPQERIPLRPEAPIDPGDALPAWLDGERSRPLIYLTLGTYVSGQIDSLRAAAAGLGTLDADVLVAVGPDGDPDALGPLPESVRVECFVAQGRLLPQLDAVVHHGGSGTMLGALAHGVPQLLLPHGADQFINAQALLPAGAALRLLPEEITPDAVAYAVQTLLSEQRFRGAAEEIAAEIASMPAPAEVVPVLERVGRG